MYKNECDRLPTDQQKTGQNLTFDIYKGILVVLVVIRYVLQYSVSDEGGILANFIWAMQMPGFMLVAGYFSARRIKNAAELGELLPVKWTVK